MRINLPNQDMVDSFEINEGYKTSLVRRKKRVKSAQ